GEWAPEHLGLDRAAPGPGDELPGRGRRWRGRDARGCRARAGELPRGKPQLALDALARAEDDAEERVALLATAGHRPKARPSVTPDRLEPGRLRAVEPRHQVGL